MKLEDVFRTRTAARLLDLLLASPDRVYTQAMLVSRLGLDKRTVPKTTTPKTTERIDCWVQK
jgi:hypothetical protein